MLEYLGLFYAAIFWVVASKRPLMALVAIFALSPLQFNLGGGGLSFSIAEVNLLLTLPLFLQRLRTVRTGLSLGPLTQPLGIYFLVCILTSLPTWRGLDAAVSIVQMLIYTVITVLMFATLISVEDLRRVPYYIVPVAVLWSIIGLATHFNLHEEIKKNAFGASLAATFLVAFDLWLVETYRKNVSWNKNRMGLYLMASMLVILVGLVLSLSRGAWLGAITGIMVIAILRRASVQMMRFSVLCVPLILVLWNTLPRETQEYALGFDADRYNIQARYKSVNIAEENFSSSPILGQGIGLRKQYDATNLLWSTLAETGIVGALAFGWLVYAFYRLAWRSRFIVPPSDPMFSLLSIGAALMTCKMMHGMVDHYWSRGTITMAWAGAGMVLAFSRLPYERQRIQAQWVANIRKQRRPVPPFANGGDMRPVQSPVQAPMQSQMQSEVGPGA